MLFIIFIICWYVSCYVIDFIKWQYFRHKLICSFWLIFLNVLHLFLVILIYVPPYVIK